MLPQGVRRLFRLELGRQATAAAEVDDEIRAHLAMRIERLMSQGLTHEQASAEALRRFGPIAPARRRITGARRRTRTRMDLRESAHSYTQDVRFALRQLLRAPGWTLTIVLTLAIAIGATTSVYGVARAVLLQRLPFADPDQLYTLRLADRPVTASKSFLADLRARQRTFEDVAGYSGWRFTLTGNGEPESVSGARTTPTLFPLLGARAALGRVLLPSDGVAGAPAVVVLSDALWHRRFGADSSIVGRGITVGGEPAVVVGVMPATFAFPNQTTLLWAAAPMDPANKGDYHAGYLTLVGRLRAGITTGTAAAELRAMQRAIRRDQPTQYPETYGTGSDVVPLADTLVGSLKKPLAILLGGAMLVLLVACTNVANLLLARGVGRTREIAVRTALGARRTRIVRQLLTESVTLAIIGGGLGIGLAVLGTRALAAAIPADVIRASPGVDVRIVAFSLATAVISALIFGTLPALLASRADLRSDLTTRGGSARVSRTRLLGALVSVQMALAFTLVTGAGLMAATVYRLVSVDPGFRADEVTSIRVSPPAARFPAGPLVRDYYDRVFERVRAVPGVRDVGAIHLLPMGGSNWNPSVDVEGREVKVGQKPAINWRAITPEYFRTMRIPLITGRSFTAADDSTASPAGIINRTFAEQVFPGENPLGRRVRTAFDKQWVTIVGVVGDTRDMSLKDAAVPQLYRPHRQYSNPSLTLMVRGDTNTSVSPALLRTAIWSVDRNVPLDVVPLGDVIAKTVKPSFVLTALLSGFGLIALVLGVLGVYGVLAYAVSQRTHEIGMRLALGATRSTVVRLVAWTAARFVVPGLIVGVVVTRAAGRLMESQLFGVSSGDPIVVGAVTLLLTVAAAAAALLPALRAATIDPATALRTE